MLFNMSTIKSVLKTLAQRNVAGNPHVVENRPWRDARVARRQIAVSDSNVPYTSAARARFLQHSGRRNLDFVAGHRQALTVVLGRPVKMTTEDCRPLPVMMLNGRVRRNFEGIGANRPVAEEGSGEAAAESLPH